MRRIAIRLAQWLAIGWAISAAPAFAALTWDLRTGSSATNTQALLIDSNQCPAKGPLAAYVGGIITNTGPGTVTGIVATATGFNANVFLTGGQPASQSIGTLAPGESIGVYWYTGYGCTDAATASIAIGITSSLGSQSPTVATTIRKSLSANAGGNVQSATLGPGAVVGQTVYFDTVYDFGGTSAGDEYFLQPSGGLNFNAACFRLTGSEVRSSNLNAATVGTLNRFYFVQPNNQPGNGYNIGIRYSFQYLCANTSSTARPYADQTSGTQLKYTGNFDGTGSISISYPGATNPFTISKSVSPASAFTGGTGNLTYTVTISNPSIHATILDRITDQLPAGMAFVAISAGSGVTAANSSSMPAGGATGTLTFQGKLGSSYALPGGGSVSLIYTATRPSATGTYVNSAQGSFGQATTPVAQASFSAFTLSALSAVKTSVAWSDPINGLSNPKHIPGGVVQYAIGVTNPNALPMDGDSVVVSDRTPSGLKMCLADLGGSGSGPVSFTDGSPSSTLTYSFTTLGSATDSLEFSNNSGTSWTYTPAADADGCDAAITDFRVRPVGSLAGSGTFSIGVRYRIN